MRVFVTGASGWIGSAVVPELLAAGHEVVGLARSDSSARSLQAAGAQVQRGTMDDLDVLHAAAQAADGVIHLAFKHDIAFSGQYQAAADADRLAVETFGKALAGSGKPLVIASGTLGLTPGRVLTESDGQLGDQGTRHVTARIGVALADQGVRPTVLRLPPTVHGQGDNGFMASIVNIARTKRVSAYVGDGSNRWPAVHRLDAAALFRLALEKAPAGSTVHAVADEGVPLREVAEVIGRHLDVPVVSIDPADAAEHFTWLGGFIGLDSPAASTATRQMLGWQPTQPGLVEDLDKGHYFGA